MPARLLLGLLALAAACSAPTREPTTCDTDPCTTPPSATCTSTSVLRTWASPGVCQSDGTCGYAPVDVPCAGGCADGKCANDKCAGVTCAAPPAAICVNANTLRTFAAAGSCDPATGECRYERTETTCAEGCSGGQCTQDKCAGVTCDTPPAATCVSPTTLRTYNAPGTCRSSNGSCSYQARDSRCTGGCVDGRCQTDPCAGITCTTPPAAVCKDASTLRTFAATGTCGGGQCSYAPTDSSCPAGCADGRCNADPCAGITCRTPPAASCVDGKTLRTYAANGTCGTGGACSYAPTNVTCAGSCVDGACVGGRATAVSAGEEHTCAITERGALLCFGSNVFGALGLEPQVQFESAVPVAPEALAGPVAAVAAGYHFTCVLSAAGAVSCWGLNTEGELGDGSKVTRHEPTLVDGLASGVSAIGVGTRHACAVVGGAVKCWGANSSGQLGDGTTTERTSPVAVQGLTGAVAVAAGDGFSCALRNNGTVVCWGSNGFGQLGDDSFDSSRPVPGAAVTGLTNVLQITAAQQHACARTRSGAVSCWGYNGSGQLGDGTTSYSRHPVAAIGLSAGVQDVDAGSFRTCAVTAEGAVSCWGQVNQYVSRSSPGVVESLAAGFVQVSAGGSHTCALSTAGSVRCLGKGTSGQLGDGMTSDSVDPVSVRVLNAGDLATGIVAGASHTCVRTATGGVDCWGSNDAGQLGEGSRVDRHAPTPAFLPDATAALAAGESFTCALSTAGGVRCWGSSIAGQLGNGTPYLSLVPVDVTGLASGVSAIATGRNHACALLAGGTVKCWGSDSDGQCGDNANLTTRSTPVDVLNLAGASAIAAGGDHTCAITGAGSVKCWGDNDYGQLGDNSVSDRVKPVDVPALASGVQSLALGEDFTCALLATGAVQCWGSNLYGQLGDGTATDRHVPTPVVGLSSGVTAIAAGREHACALLATGAVKCWGRNNANGVLGDGSTTLRNVPVPVGGLADAVGIAIGENHACAVVRSGGVKCWGDNLDGQLGAAGYGSRTPVSVEDL